MRIFVSRGGVEYGPYTAEDLASFVSDGTVSPEDWGRAEDGVRWVPVRELLGGTGPGPAAPSCTNHPGRAAVSACVSCQRPFCGDCVDSPGGVSRCGPCLRSRAPVSPRAVPGASRPATAAKAALVLSIVGISCLGIVLEPIAIVLALSARRAIDASRVPLEGRGAATAALVIGTVSFALWALVTVLKLAGAF